MNLAHCSLWQREFYVHVLLEHNKLRLILHDFVNNDIYGSVLWVGMIG